MPTSFPASIDTFTNPAINDKLNVPSHAAQHTDENTALTAVETKLGTGASVATANNVLKGTGAGATAFGKIVNADIDAAAAIAYSKLSLVGGITNADIVNAAAVAYSKLNLTGSIVNADISAGAAIALSKLAADNWTAYTPVWSGSGTAPVIGNGLIYGSYLKIGRMYFFCIYQEMGASTTYGNGNYTWTLPNSATVASNIVQYSSITGYALDVSVGAEYPLLGRLAPTATTINMSCYHTNAGFTDAFGLDYHQPFTFAASDFILFSGWFLATA